MNHNNTAEKEYIAIDGDSIGKLLEKYIVTNNLDRLRLLSADIQHDIDHLSDLITNIHGYIIMKGGDNILCQCDVEYSDNIIEELLNINNDREYHFSVGIGNNAINAYLALKHAKLSKNTVIRLITDTNNKFEILHG